LLIVRQTGLHLLEVLLVDDGGHLRDGYPLGGVSQGMACISTANWHKRRLAMASRRILIAAHKHGSGVDGVGKNAPHRRLIPAPVSAGRGYVSGHESFRHPDQAESFLQIPRDHFSNHCGFIGLYTDSRWISWA